uniref:Uncharacterized protein n=1 Tax=Myotis myotis TaxID=51298 RepID=A0A7J7WVP7_MYOMY|nr:hypothetical protein mMyoMyo1_011941 [Myotis myotis]
MGLLGTAPAFLKPQKGFAPVQGSQPQGAWPGIAGTPLFQVQFGGHSLETGWGLRTQLSVSTQQLLVLLGRSGQGGPQGRPPRGALGTRPPEVVLLLRRVTGVASWKMDVFLEPSTACQTPTVEDWMLDDTAELGPAGCTPIRRMMTHRH